jgi:predicted short-subunit dehydrogenase-like oxidoreductase (DUF2520 family)
MSRIHSRIPTRAIQSVRRPKTNGPRTNSFLGAGALASGLARLLHAQGYAIGEIVARPGAASQRRALRLAREVGAVATTLSRAQLQCDVLWLAVPDSAIEQVACELAAKLAQGTKQLAAETSKARGQRQQQHTPQLPGRMGHPQSSAALHLPRVVLHASGALSSHVLQPLAEFGIETGSAHPMMTFIAGEPPKLEGAWFAVEGTPAAVRAARAMAKELGANSFRIAPENKSLYHAFGAMLSPMLAAELEAAERVGLRAGIEPRQVRRIMEPIVLRTVRNVLRNGAGKSFSGPLARGDVSTVAEHLQALRDEPEGSVYRALMQYATGTLPVKRVEEMKKLLATSTGQRPSRSKEKTKARG